MRLAPYLTVFVVTGTIAVVIKLLGEHAESRLAGIVAMVPMKILIAWVLLDRAGGSAAVREGTEGMAIGLVAFAALLATAWWASGRYALGGVMATSLTVWALTVAALGHATARPSEDAGATGPGATAPPAEPREER
ncbi:MAG: GlpM family protein [Planctomycetota bacterium]|nr:GlpM family protein [Planctomycetota bacterium]